MCKNKIDTKDLKAAKEEKIRTYLQVSLKLFTATIAGLAEMVYCNNLPLLRFFPLFFCSLSAIFCSLFRYLFAAPVRSLEGLIYSLNMSSFRKDSRH